MKLLFDTHTLVWWLLASPRLSLDAREMLHHPKSVLHVSAASAWELATKVRAKKWSEANEVAERLDEVVAVHGLAEAPVTIAHGRHAGLLEGAHRDPFDRILAAQAILDDMTLVTADPAFRAFDVRVAW